MAKQNLVMTRANDFLFDGQVLLNGSALNVTGYHFRFVAKWNISDSDGSALININDGGGITITGASTGNITVKIARSLTNVSAVPYNRVDLPYDLIMTDSTPNVYTLLSGTLTILPNVTQTSP